MGYLKLLEIENFKSYKGKHLIGPFKKFMSIIGPNGSGKSNLMDAICFVLGEKAQNFRVRKLADLIHGASIGKPIGTRCYVKMTYKNDDESETTFTRTVTNNGSELRVDGNTVTTSEYHSYLEQINIFIKAKNFLVYQGAVEQIAMKSPKEITQIFEELSKSGELSTDYNKLKAEMEKLKKDTHFNLQKRRGVAAEKLEVRDEMKEAKRYQTMKDSFDKAQMQLYLIQLFYAEKARDKAKVELQKLNEEIGNFHRTKIDDEEEIEKCEQELRKAVKELRRMENEVEKFERNLITFRPELIESKQELAHVKRKVETTKKIHLTTAKMAKEQEQNLKELEKQQLSLQDQRKKCEEKLKKDSQRHSLHLDHEQIVEYNQLKSVAEKQNCRVTSQIEELQQDREAKKIGIHRAQHEIKTIEDQIKQKESELERHEKSKTMIEESRENQIQMLEEEKKSLVTVEKEILESKDLLEKYSNRLHEVNKEISDAHGDSIETEHTKRRNEAVENLKRLYPDKVHGRLVDICNPTHQKYNLAMTKVLGGNMNAIIVDTDDIAEECIIYLKEQRYFSEKFLPLNSLVINSINEMLREISEPKGVKLLFDVINCFQPSIRKAIQFTTNNAVVCETTEDARHMAYGIAGHRYKSVSLDGTLFQQNGIVSGGSLELRDKAKKWDEQKLRKLREERAELQNKIEKLQQNAKRNIEIEIKQNQIKQIENRIQFTKFDYGKLQNEIIPRLRRELVALRCQLTLIQPRIDIGEKELKEIEEEIEKLEVEKNSISDSIFANFCQKIGIDDIREYENREITFYQEYQRQLKTFEAEIARLQYEIDFLKSDDKRKKEKEEAEKIQKLQEFEGKLEMKVEKQMTELKKMEGELRKAQNNAADQRSTVLKKEVKYDEAKKVVQTIDRNLSSMEKKVKNLEQIEAKKSQKRHSLLHECKIAGIEIPLKSGRLEDVMIMETSDDTDNNDENYDPRDIHQRHIIDNIIIDFEALEDKTKRLKSDAEIEKLIENYFKAVKDAQGNLAKISAPNLRANKRMEEVRSKEDETKEEYENARKKAVKAQTAFEKVKNERYKLFTDFFEPISQQIDEIYKHLSRNESAQAFLGPENQEEPYLDGINYNCVAPGKRFRPMDNLSGGEKTIAALALLFAIHSKNPSPFFILDEMDAALDNTNIQKVVSYICERSKRDMQIIVISLKEECYNKADGLIGIYQKPTNVVTSSGVLTFDLTNFKSNLHDSMAAV
uniref:Structural maintenance of chromosomes protein n=1 Tax=Panagrolaimus superbus TaxID=310955 RepID=A0A914ZAR2_9BILA